MKLNIDSVEKRVEDIAGLVKLAENKHQKIDELETKQGGML